MAGDSTISPLFIHSLFKAGALAKSGDSRPFDKKRDGFVMGEGGGAIILETEDHAIRRGAPIKAALLGCANNSDAYHPVSPEPNGNGAAACMRLALEQAGLRPEDIGYINAHGTATLQGDVAETKAIKQVFGSYRVPVSSTKGATGHLLGAGGITEVIACVKAIETGILPPNIHCDEQDEACDLNILANAPAAKHIDIAMSNAFGFGGQNSNIIVGRYNG
ncbi:3-oxoacyl-[acyl-carrier-protein] synthase 2 [bioreactor metagenome]|uniref:3-oxoacyl-[acyl-carrier-protein] synthase 2 n=1 Tax=bioreactor metagenome TaxID=1076179 RepID=A0A645FT33_9ZZZZ